MKKRITIGILAHVDAGKTTLSEALLYSSGKIRSLGRVAAISPNVVTSKRGSAFIKERSVRKFLQNLSLSSAGRTLLGIHLSSGTFLPLKFKRSAKQSIICI